MKNLTSTLIRKLIPLTLAVTGLIAAVGCSKESNPVSSDSKVVAEAADIAGTYNTNYRWGGANGLWRGPSTLTVTKQGEVTYGTTQIIKPIFGEDLISWTMADGNSTNAAIHFEDESSSDYFWRDKGGVKDLNFTGWIQNPGEGKLDFRGLIK